MDEDQINWRLKWLGLFHCGKQARNNVFYTTIYFRLLQDLAVRAKAGGIAVMNCPPGWRTLL